MPRQIMINRAPVLTLWASVVAEHLGYEQFRPAIPPGRRGWGAKGALDLDFIRSPGRSA